MINYIIDFLENKNIENSDIFKYLKVSIDEAKILRYLTKEYVEGIVDTLVTDLLKNNF